MFSEIGVRKFVNLPPSGLKFVISKRKKRAGLNIKKGHTPAPNAEAYVPLFAVFIHEIALLKTTRLLLTISKSFLSKNQEKNSKNAK